MQETENSLNCQKPELPVIQEVRNRVEQESGPWQGNIICTWCNHFSRSVKGPTFLHHVIRVCYSHSLQNAAHPHLEYGFVCSVAALLRVCRIICQNAALSVDLRRKLFVVSDTRSPKPSIAHPPVVHRFYGTNSGTAEGADVHCLVRHLERMSFHWLLRSSVGITTIIYGS